MHGVSHRLKLPHLPTFDFNFAGKKRTSGARFGLKGGYSAAAVDGDSGEANGIQVYITRAMRSALEDKLGYSAREVDDMDPQVGYPILIENIFLRSHFHSYD